MTLVSDSCFDQHSGPECAYLVTGGNGFIGQPLVQELLKKGRSITCLSRAQNAASNAILHIPVDLGDNGRVTDIQAAIRNHQVVIHLANRAHVMGEEHDAALNAFRATNVLGTLNLARAAISAGVKRFIFLSSIKVNGESTHHQPFSVDDAPNPMNPYAVSKHEAETGLQELCSNSPMELVIIRPPLVYGPEVKGNLATLTRWIDKGHPLPFGALDNQRDLIGLNNLVDLIITCIDHPKAAGQVFLGSDNRRLSTPELIRFIAEARQQPARLWKVPPGILKAILAVVGKQDAYARLAGDLRIDMRPTQELLGWTPPYSVEESMQWAFGRRSEFEAVAR